MFSICEDLGIDDPVHWMNSVSPVVVDLWIAFRSVKCDLESEAIEKAEGNNKMTPDDAGAYIHSIVGSKINVQK